MNRNLTKVSFALALTALVVAVLGTTALGSAAGNAVSSAASAPLKAAGLTQTDAKPRRGPRGPRGPRGFRGPRGLQGLKGDKGDKGDTGTVDTSNFFTKTQSDARYAAASALGNSRLFSGLDFNTIISTTTWDTAGFLGKFETGGGIQFLYAPLNALPTGAAITKVDFYLLHNVAGSASVYLSEGVPTTPTEGYLYTAATSTQNASVQTVTVTPPSPIVFGPDSEGLLFWEPSAQSNQDIIYGARVFYNPPAPG